MFRLLRYYSVASAVAILVVTVILGFVYRQQAVDELIVTAESQNISLARSFANSLWPKFSAYVTMRVDEDADVLRGRPETSEIHDMLSRLTAELPVLKVKVYNLEGLTVYSSEPSQIGEDKSANTGFLASARDGVSVSKLSHRDTFSSFSGSVSDRHLVESYVAVRGADGAIEGVFELYSDVTPLMGRIDDVTIKLVVSLLLAFGLLYAVLSQIVRRADKILRRQYVELVNDKELIKSQNTALEHENRERKFAEDSLREARDMLEARVVERTAELEREVEVRLRAENDMRLAKEQAELANRNKTEFLANISHELRTPLNAIIGFSELILNNIFGPVGSPKYLDYAKDINASGEHLLDVINDILDLSKIEAGKVELSEQNVDVGAALNSCIALVKGHAEAGGVHVENTTGSDLPALYADERKFTQILINLLSNAVKFTLAGGRVTVTAWASPQDGYRVQIADTGIGIAAEDIPKVMGSFGQVDSGLNRKFEGTGLGLPLAKSLAELHGGELELQSELGVGTSVTIRFPATRIASRLGRAIS
ncbi:MAG: ATP-binding protein [Alphaproteobacteria bacterium]|jgi:signal transduction histidine kinase|nr:ATP-binding protein [Alphaproteobacteria bacterium]|tara:strand:+ start:1135 stop:2754 length:1620 start_codon:yes stop_codon:yes gene_type:complete